jgi:hypothetical protein
MKAGSFVIFVAPAMTVAACIPGAMAHEQPRRHYNLPEQDMKQAVRSVARHSKHQLIADPAGMRGKRSKALVGDYTVREAMGALLAGSGLTFEIKDRTILIRPPLPQPRV